MELQDILENEKLNKFLTNCMDKTYNKYKLQNAISLEDFYQETYMYLIPRLRKFDSEKSSIDTFIPLVVMTSGKQVLSKAIGQSKKRNKVEIANQTISIDTPFSLNTGGGGTYSASNFSEFIPSDVDIENDVMLKTQINEILNMSNLSEKQRTILKLLLKDYSFTEISEMLDKSFVSVWQCFDRARNKIQRKYEIAQ